LNGLTQRFATLDPTLCMVCRRQATGLAYVPTVRPARMHWLCHSAGCFKAAMGVYVMPQDKLNTIEKDAARAAIDSAGPYLDEIGTTDLALLNGEQMDEFLARLLRSYEDEMRRRLLGYVRAPF